MKPLHVGLLVMGAALAGGLAMKMTQPPVMAIPVTAAKPVVAVVTPPKAEPEPAPPAVVTPAPAPVYEEPPAAPTVRAKVKPVLVARATPPPRVVPVALPAPRRYEASALPPPSRKVVEAVQIPEPVAVVPDPLPPAPEPARPAPPVAREVTLQAGTTVPVRLLQTISSEHAVAGDTFQATLADPLVIGGLVIAERGARVSGRILDSKSAGRFNGQSLIELSLTSFQTADGQRVSITTHPWAKQTDANARATNDAARIGGGAALGAIIGAIAGGGKGAAIGAGAGGAAGAGSIAVQKPKGLEVPSETLIRFRLAARVIITERPL